MPDPYRPIYRAATLIVLLCCSAVMVAQTPSGTTAPAPASEIRVTHLLGLAGAKNNAKGELSIQDNALRFQKDGSPAVQVNISSIQDIFLGEQSKQLGGTAATLGKAGTPFGGGRVISLFAHKKYDTFTLEYVDANGGFHGAIFQMNKGQGQAFKDELVAKGAHVTEAENQPPKQSNQEVKYENK